MANRAVYFYDSNLQLVKQGSILEDEGLLSYSEDAAVINQGDINQTRLAVALPLATFSGGFPTITFRTPKGYTSAIQSMSQATWLIDSVNYQVFYIDMTTVNWTFSAGRHAFMVGYMVNSGFTNLELSFYTVSDGVNAFEDTTADNYEEIYTALYATFDDLASRLTNVEDYLANGFNFNELTDYSAATGIDRINLYSDDGIAILSFDGTNLLLNRNAVDEEVMTVLNEIGDLANVVITSAATDDILIYNSTNWVNITKTAFLTAVNAAIDDIKDGTTIVAKATGDKDGNPIDTTYETKANATAERATKANLAGGNNFDGNQNVNGTINAEGITVVNASITSQLNKNNTKIVNLGNGSNPGDAINKSQLDSSINNHDINALAHEPIRLLIQDLDREISRLDGRGVSYGEVPYTTAELQAMDSTTLLNTIIAAVEAKSWFEGTYTPSNGDLVYDEGVGDGVNYHEWEYNQDAGDWADNGAIASPKATNDIFGTVKGNSYVSIVAGLMQILLADNATYLKDSSSTNKYTYQQIYDAIANRYTKTEVDALLNQLKAIYGWEDSDLGLLDDDDYIAWSVIEQYDLIIVSVYDTISGAKQFVTQTFKPSNISETDRIWLGLTYNATDYFKTYVFKVATNLHFQVASETTDARCIVTGIKMDGTVHNEMRSVGSETITYRDDGKISAVVADTITTTPTYDEYGNITKITEVYALDSKTYETTFTYDKFGRISATNKVEV